jgi:hypothetical protein
MVTEPRISPVVLGRAVRCFCGTNESFDILRSTSGEARSCGWSDGGCWILAAAIQQRWGGELYALSRTGSEAQHAAIRFEKILIDQDGPASAKTFIRRFERWEGFLAGSLQLVPFSSTMNRNIPKPEKQREIVAGILSHIPSPCPPDASGEQPFSRLSDRTLGTRIASQLWQSGMDNEPQALCRRTPVPNRALR